MEKIHNPATPPTDDTTGGADASPSVGLKPAPPTNTPPADDAAVEAKIVKAEAMVSALCQPHGTAGKREWTMSIPARPDHDPDLVIADALHSASKQIAALRANVERLTRERDEAMRQKDVCRRDANETRDRAITAAYYAVEIADHAEACGIVSTPAYDLAVQRIRTVRACDTPVPALQARVAELELRDGKASLQIGDQMRDIDRLAAELAEANERAEKAEAERNKDTKTNAAIEAAMIERLKKCGPLPSSHDQVLFRHAWGPKFRGTLQFNGLVISCDLASIVPHGLITGFEPIPADYQSPFTGAHAAGAS